MTCSVAGISEWDSNTGITLVISVDGYGGPCNKIKSSENRNHPRTICSGSFALVKGCWPQKGVNVFTSAVLLQLLYFDKRSIYRYVPSPRNIAACFWRSSLKTGHSLTNVFWLWLKSLILPCTLG